MYRPLLLLPLLCTIGCKPSASPPRESVRTFEVRGVVQKTMPDSRRVVIAHDAIDGYMDAMTMEFEAADARELHAVQPGDVIAFRLTVSDERSLLDRVRKTGTAPLAAAVVSDAPAPGAQLPDCTLIDSHGESLHLADFRGRALAITFIFTRCPLPDFCPRMNAHFATTQRLLAADGATEKCRFLSVTLDPDFDTPARLADYAKRFEPDANWRFATGTRADIEKLGAAFGLQIARTGALPDHNLRTIVITPTGRVQHIFPGNDWTPEQLAAELRRALASAR